jgi:beta-phosphoglucomutase-like phosphatase (HAD superfamily)
VANDLGVIFDMDGVLVDSYRTHLESWRIAGAERGVEMSDVDFARTFGRTSVDIIGLLWPGKFNDAEARQFDCDKEAACRRLFAEKFPEMDGAGELIGALHESGFRIGIGSSSSPENVDLVRRLLGNGRFVTASVNGSDVTRGKPDPQVFLKAAEKMKIVPGRCAVVEDAMAGVEAARRAGMAAIGLVGTTPAEKLAAQAHLVVDSLRKLTPAIIQRTIENNGRS